MIPSWLDLLVVTSALTGRQSGVVLGMLVQGTVLWCVYMLALAISIWDGLQGTVLWGVHASLGCHYSGCSSRLLYCGSVHASLGCQYLGC